MEAGRPAHRGRGRRVSHDPGGDMGPRLRGRPPRIDGTLPWRAVPMTKIERETAERFAERYRVGPAEVSRRVELAVIGGDWGANGDTTMAQAGLLGRELRLPPGARLPDRGARRRRP